MITVTNLPVSRFIIHHREIRKERKRPSKNTNLHIIALVLVAGTLEGMQNFPLEVTAFVRTELKITTLTSILVSVG